jgi:signal transduction histidine kinase
VDESSASPGQLLAASRFLAAEGTYGLVWLDADLRATSRHGSLVTGVPLKTTIMRAMPVFVGLENDFAVLRQERGRSLVIPNIMIANAGVAGAGSHGLREGTRVNLSVYWIDEEGCYLLLVVRAGSQGDLEHRLAAEIRARSIAESEVAAQTRLVRRVNDELAIANSDLAEFASVISHDLRAPLRGLRYAAADARRAMIAGDSGAAVAHLERTLAQARRMGAMLTGLLDYARAGRKSDNVELVDTRALVGEIVESLRSTATQTFAIEGPWPSIVTVAEPLDIVLRNIIENAVKHHDRADGRIIVRSEEIGGSWLISVIDDGPGIALEWQKAIFQPFRQIADSDAVEGAGIGLALVKRTVERLGGTVEVHSNPTRERGTTFRVSWPATITA